LKKRKGKGSEEARGQDKSESLHPSERGELKIKTDKKYGGIGETGRKEGFSWEMDLDSRERARTGVRPRGEKPARRGEGKVIQKRKLHKKSRHAKKHCGEMEEKKDIVGRKRK